MPDITPQVNRAINRSKWKPVSSPHLPNHSTQWACALLTVDKHATLLNTIPRAACGTMFPDPGYFAVVAVDKLEAATAAWLFIRAGRCGQMLHPFSGAMPVANAATWRKFFWIYAYRWPEPAETPVPPVQNRPPHAVEHYAEAVEAAREMFGPELVNNMRVETGRVRFHDVELDVLQGRAKGLTPDILKRITWELAELNWCYELLALDHVVAFDRWRLEDEASPRMDMIQDVFKPGRDFVWWNTAFPSVSPSITADNIQSRLPALRTLRRLMVHWQDCPAALLVTLPFDTNEAAAVAFEKQVLSNYCSTFYVHFGRPPIVPMRLPA